MLTTITKTDPKDVDWKSINWIKSNVEISFETGMDYHKIRMARKLFAPRSYKIGSAKTRHIDFSAIDWTKPNCELAREMKLAPGIVRGYRRKFGKPFPGDAKAWSIMRKITNEKLEAADWLNKRDQDLSVEWGVSRERVRQIRQERGYEKCQWHKKSLHQIELMAWIKTNQAMIEGKRVKDVARIMPGKLSYLVKMKILNQSGIEFDYSRGPSKKQSLLYKYHDIVNWQLPNRDIELIWQSPYNRAGGLRYNLAKGTPHWQGQRKRSFRHDPEYVTAVEAEIVKARNCGVQVPDNLMARLIRAYQSEPAVDILPLQCGSLNCAESQA